MSRLVGTLLGQNYRVVEPIGVGGMGMVFVVEHVHLPKRFAAKVLSPDLARHPEAIARFEVEAQAVSQLEHENIVSIVDYGKTDDGSVFIIMELLRGKTLQARIDQGPLSLEEIVAIMIQVCRALAAAHAAGIVHRDIKPDNVFLHQWPGMRPLVKVFDFGVSKARESSVRDGRITRQGQILGSPEYMSPEASRGEEVDARADIYAVGIMLYQLLCGDVPFRHENYLEVLQMHAARPPVPPRALTPDLPDAVERLILCALEKDPARRQPSIEAFELELTAAMPEVAQRAVVAAQIPPYAPQALSSAQPVAILDDAPPQLGHGSLPQQAPTVEDDGATLDTRRRRGRAFVVALWGCAVGVAVAAGIGLWLERRDLVHRAPAPDRAGAASVGAPPEPVARPFEPPADRSEASGDGDRTPPPAPARDIQIPLHIDSSPRGATVTLDGRRLGRTPLDTQVPSADRHGWLELDLGGYRTARRSIASRDRDGDIRVSLEREGRRRPQSGGSESSGRSGEGGKGADQAADGPEIKESR